MGPSMNHEKPLLGKTIMVTRSKEQADSLVNALEKRGAKVIDFPLIRIEPPDSWNEIDNALVSISSYQWMVFTSVNGVDACMRRIEHLQIEHSAFAGVRICAVGKATKEALEKHGLIVTLMPLNYTTKELLKELQKQVHPNDSVFMARADIADPALSIGLEDLCAKVTDVVAYKTLFCNPQQKSKLLTCLSKIEYITLASASAVKSLASSIEHSHLQDIKAVCIGPVTLREAEKLSFLEIHMANIFTVEGIVQKIVELEEKKGSQ